MCPAYRWVWSCSTHTAHNTLTALTSAHLWCVSTVEMCMSSAGKVHTPMSVWSPHLMDVPHNTHLCVHTAHSCAQYVSITHRCLCCGQLDSYMQWNKDPNTMLSGSQHFRGVCTPHCSVHATCFNHEDQVPMSHS